MQAPVQLATVELTVEAFTPTTGSCQDCGRRTLVRAAITTSDNAQVGVITACTECGETSK